MSTGLVGTSIAIAEMEGKEYESTAPVLSDEERARIRHEIENELEADRRRRAEAARRDEQELLRRSSEQAALPVGEVLLQSRCLHCHDRERIDLARYGTIGWLATALRMRWLNDAPMSAGEMTIIARYLAERHPPSMLWRGAEWLLLTSPAILIWGGWRRWRALARR